MERVGGGPAFPCDPLWRDGEAVPPVFPGLSIREYLAGQIAAGDAACQSGWSNDVDDKTIAARVVLYYRIADAMLKARNGPV